MDSGGSVGRGVLNDDVSMKRIAVVPGDVRRRHQKRLPQKRLVQISICADALPPPSILSDGAAGSCQPMPNSGISRWNNRTRHLFH